MNPQSPQQQPASQSQGSLPTPPRPQSPPKKPRHTQKGFWHGLSKKDQATIIVAIIGAVGVVIAAIITAIVGPSILARISPSVTLTPHPSSPSSPSPNVYPPSGWKLAFDDPLKIDEGYWHVSAGCKFINNVYQVSVYSGDFVHRCINANTDYTAFAAEVQMTIVNGDEGGLEFRENYDTASYYEFWISQGGTYGLEIWENNTLSTVLKSESNAAINTGLNQPNLIAVVAQGNTFQLYANKQLLDTVTDKDSSYGHGSIALEAYSVSTSKPTVVLFNNIKVWTPNS